MSECRVKGKAPNESAQARLAARLTLPPLPESLPRLTPESRLEKTFPSLIEDYKFFRLDDKLKLPPHSASCTRTVHTVDYAQSRCDYCEASCPSSPRSQLCPTHVQHSNKSS